MDRFTTCTSIYARLPIQDIDTDLIIPAEFLTSISRSGYGQNLFRRLRDNDPSFFMHDATYASAKILVAGKNFGCGSSREHAVWALMGAGFKVIIASSFADIFTENAAKNGLLLVQLSQEAIDKLVTAPKETTLEVSLEDQTVKTSFKEEFSFTYDSFKKHCLLEGMDELTYLLSKKETIQQFFSEAPVQKFQSRL